MNEQDIPTYAEVRGHIIADGGKRWPGGWSRVVFTNGCFDILHAGHLKVFDECRRLAGPRGAVVVGVNSDASVGRLKGSNRPIIGERQRCLLLAGLRHVDYVVTFDEDTPKQLIDSIRPDIIVKGGEYRKEDVVGSDVAPVVLVEMDEGVSTTSILEKIRGQ